MWTAETVHRHKKQNTESVRKVKNNARGIETQGLGSAESFHRPRQDNAESELDQFTGIETAEWVHSESVHECKQPGISSQA